MSVLTMALLVWCRPSRQNWASFACFPRTWITMACSGQAKVGFEISPSTNRVFVNVISSGLHADVGVGYLSRNPGNALSGDSTFPTCGTDAARAGFEKEEKEKALAIYLRLRHAGSTYRNFVVGCDRCIRRLNHLFRIWSRFRTDRIGSGYH